MQLSQLVKLVQLIPTDTTTIKQLDLMKFKATHTTCPLTPLLTSRKSETSSQCPQEPGQGRQGQDEERVRRPVPAQTNLTLWLHCRRHPNPNWANAQPYLGLASRWMESRCYHRLTWCGQSCGGSEVQELQPHLWKEPLAEIKGKRSDLTSHFLGYERVIRWNLPYHWNLRGVSIREGKQGLEILHRRGNDADQSDTAQKSPKLVHTLDGIDKHEVVAHVGVFVKDGSNLDRPWHHLQAWRRQHKKWKKNHCWRATPPRHVECKCLCSHIFSGKMEFQRSVFVQQSFCKIEEKVLNKFFAQMRL